MKNILRNKMSESTESANVRVNKTVRLSLEPPRFTYRTHMC